MVEKRDIFGFVLFLLSICVLLSSCDLFWGTAWQRSSRDPKAQLGTVHLLPSGGSSLAFAWDWRPFLSGDPAVGGEILDGESEIVELRVLHGTGSPPTFTPPLPFGDLVQDRLDPDGWYAVYDDLDEDREHYFSLYAREKGGAWIGPKTLSSSHPYSEGPQNGSFLSTSGWSVTDTAGASVASGSAVVNDTSGLFLSFSDSLEGWQRYLESSSISSISITVNSGGRLEIYPVRFDLDPTTEFQFLRSSRLPLDETAMLTKEIAIGDSAVSISAEETEQLLRRMLFFQVHAVYLRAEDGLDITALVFPSFNFSYRFN